MSVHYSVYCSYRIGRRYAKRTLARGLPLKAARALQCQRQAGENRRFTKRRGYWSSWSGRIYGIQRE